MLPSNVGSVASDFLLREMIAKVAPSRATVLITGESGVGKEVVANEIHRMSGRRGKFVARNCAALGEGPIESELFGHERGAFTGAERRRGIFEQAQDGTVFLDEVTEMKPELQAKLLRVLEENKVIRVGGQAATPVKVRVIAATNRSPQEAVAQGKLRCDLYYSLKAIQMIIPPLRERIEDLEDLVPHLIREVNREDGKEVEGIESECFDAMRNYSWPGNVRELRNVIQQAVITRERGFLTVEDLPDEIWKPRRSNRQFLVSVGTTLRSVEHELIQRTLEETGGNRTRAADMLGVLRRTFYLMLHKNGFGPRFRNGGTTGSSRSRS